MQVLGVGDVERGSRRSATLLAAVTALVLLLSGCPQSSGDGAGSGGGYHLRR